MNCADILLGGPSLFEIWRGLKAAMQDVVAALWQTGNSHFLHSLSGGMNNEAYPAVSGVAANRRSGRLRFRDASGHGDTSANAGPCANVHAHTDGNACFARHLPGYAHTGAGAYGGATWRQHRNRRTRTQGHSHRGRRAETAGQRPAHPRPAPDRRLHFGPLHTGSFRRAAHHQP